MKTYNVGIVGATGMVGQRFATLLENHPWFRVKVLAASPRSAGKTYEEAVGSRWAMDVPMPAAMKDMVIRDASKVEDVAKDVDFVFCAVDMPKAEIKALEEAYAKAECPVVSNNSAHRGTPDVPMIIPELIRLLMQKGIELDEAIEITTNTCAYTNHTILAEALEKWPLAFIEKVAPQIVPIIHELDLCVKDKYDDESVYIIDEDDRVHMAHIGHPVVGDPVYCRKKPPFETQGQMLHAGKLMLTHPRTGERMEFTAPLPAYFEEILSKLRKKQR